jgi:SAM-dependent methyltransferase
MKMNSFDINKNIWSDIYKSGKSNLSYPNENFVRYFHYLYAGQNINGLKVLDYGFGSGNNLLHLYKLGADVSGIEISENAKKITLSKLGINFDHDKLFVMDNECVIPFPPESFDMVLIWHVLYYNSFSSLQKTLLTIKNLIKPGGRFLGTMIRKEDIGVINSGAGLGYEHVMNSSMGNQCGSIIQVLPTEDDIQKTFCIFDNIKIGYFESKINDAVSSHWIISGEKPI